MKRLRYLLFIFLFACAVESQTPYYHYNVWEQDNMIRVSYCSDVVGYTLLIGCSEEDVQDGGSPLAIRINGLKGYGEFAFTRTCTPMFFRVKSAVADETISL